VASAADSVVCDGQVEDQAPVARRILEEAADLQQEWMLFLFPGESFGPAARACQSQGALFENELPGVRVV
jgi:hypothetical protein